MPLGARRLSWAEHSSRGSRLLRPRAHAPVRSTPGVALRAHSQGCCAGLRPPCPHHFQVQRYTATGAAATSESLPRCLAPLPRVLHIMKQQTQPSLVNGKEARTARLRNCWAETTIPEPLHLQPEKAQPCALASLLQPSQPSMSEPALAAAHEACWWWHHAAASSR